MKVTAKRRVIFIGRGSDKYLHRKENKSTARWLVVPGQGRPEGKSYMKGSNVMDTLEHSGQMRVDLSWPWNLSTITESLRARWPCHVSSATSVSGRPSASLDCVSEHRS